MSLREVTKRETFSLSNIDDKRPLLLIGGGGHATVLADILLQGSRDVIAVVCPETLDSNPILSQFRHVSGDESILEYPPSKVQLVMGIGKMHGNAIRQQIISKFSNAGYSFATVIASSATVSDFAILGEGVQVLPGSIINARAHLSDHVIVNTGAIVEHDCYVRKHVHISPGATLCGGVNVGEGAIVGPRAVIGQGRTIGSHALIGAGCSVARDVNSSTKLLPGENRTFNGK